jgi:hypothetical protein
VKYLGHIVTSGGIKPDPEKVRAVKDFSTPKNVKEVRAFLGLAGYYRRFTSRFSEIAKPLAELTKKEIKFGWGPDQAEVFNELKMNLCCDLMLVYPDFRDPFIVATDAFGKSIGAI